MRTVPSGCAFLVFRAWYPCKGSGDGSCGRRALAPVGLVVSGGLTLRRPLRLAGNPAKGLRWSSSSRFIAKSIPSKALYLPAELHETLLRHLFPHLAHGVQALHGDLEVLGEAAVIGVHHEIKGQGIAAFVIIKEGYPADESLKDALKQHVAQKIGAIARPDQVFFTADLPKTRSGKIMRRLLRDIAEGRALGDTTTLADPAVVQALKEKYEGQEE